MATGKGLPMTPLDLDAVQTKAKINVEAHAWVSDGCWCITCRTSRDVLALADEVERLRAQVGYRHIDLDNARRMLAENVLASPQPPAPPEKLKADVWTVGPPLTYEQAKAWCDAQGLPAPTPPDPGRQSADGDPEGYGDPAPPSQKEETCRCGYPARLHGCPGFACELFEAARPAAPEVDKP